MDTLETSVAEDPRPDAGLGRVGGHNAERKTGKPAEQFEVDDSALEAGAAGTGVF